MLTLQFLVATFATKIAKATTIIVTFTKIIISSATFIVSVRTSITSCYVQRKHCHYILQQNKYVFFEREDIDNLKQPVYEKIEKISKTRGAYRKSPKGYKSNDWGISRAPKGVKVQLFSVFEKQKEFNFSAK